MAEIIYHIATTTDGFIADKNGDCPTDLFSQEGDHVPDFFNHIKEYDMVIMGSKTYEFGFKFGLQPGEQAYKGIKHLIFSTSLNFQSNEDVELIKENTIEYIKELKTLPSKKIWLCGGGNFAGSLKDNKLIDKLILKINPSIAGEGIPLFGMSKSRVKLSKEDAKIYQSGVVLAQYKIIY